MIFSEFLSSVNGHFQRCNSAKQQTEISHKSAQRLTLLRYMFWSLLTFTVLSCPSCRTLAVVVVSITLLLTGATVKAWIVCAWASRCYCKLQTSQQSAADTKPYVWRKFPLNLISPALLIFTARVISEQFHVKIVTFSPVNLIKLRRFANIGRQ